MGNELNTVEPREITLSEMTLAAIQNQGDLEKVKELWKLNLEIEANNARKAFAKSFSQAQQEIESAIKTKTNSQTHSKYADLSDVIECAKPAYTKCGFAVTFGEDDCPKEGHVRVTAEVMHCLGHVKQYHLDVPLDGVGIKGNANMTAIHGKASAIAYGRRYLMCMIWNIPTADDDGNKATATVKITDAQAHQICDLLIAKELNGAKFIEFMKVESIQDILAADFIKALTAINNTASKKASK